MTMSRCLALLGCALVGGCASPERDRARFVVTDSAGVVIAENDREGSVPTCEPGATPVFAVGAVEGDEAYELYRVFGARRLSDGRIVVANQGSSELRFYDADGRHLRSVGREGEGPGEFRNIFGLWRLPGDTIWAGDYRPWRYHVFSPEGAFVRTVQPSPLYPNSPRQWGLLDDGTAVLGSALTIRDDFRTPTPLSVLLHDPSGELIDTLGVYPYGLWGTIGASSGGIYVLFDGGTRLGARGDVIALATPELPELRVLGRDGALRRIIRWSDPNRDVTGADVEAARDELRARYADMDPAMARELVAPLVSEERPVAERFPTVAEVQIGRDGSFWVRRYPRPRLPSASRWMVFESEGALRCDVALPAEFDLTDAGDGWVLGEQPDALGVERVVMYQLSAPATTGGGQP